MEQTLRIAQCKSCGKNFLPRSCKHEYCTAECRNVFYGIKGGKIGDERECVHCKDKFKSRSVKQIFCSHECYRYYKGHVPEMESNHFGRMCEIAVIENLMYKGFHVFDSVSPACPFDLVAMKENKLYKIEVKAALRSHKGDLYNNFPENGSPDILAIYIHYLDSVVYKRKET